MKRPDILDYPSSKRDNYFDDVEKYATNLEKEIEVLKQTVRAYAKMTLHYRVGLPNLPEWVFRAIERAKLKYGDDLTKIN